MANPMSKRTTITLPDEVFEKLEQWADRQGRPTANLAAFLVEVAVRDAEERGDIGKEVSK